MKDSILNGTGDSRYLKSSIPAGTTWADALTMLINGTFPIDLNGINASGFHQVGTPYNKANVLTDALAERMELDGTATPLDFLTALTEWIEMIAGNSYYCPLADDDGYILVDDSDNVLLADWKMKEV